MFEKYHFRKWVCIKALCCASLKIPKAAGLREKGKWRKGSERKHRIGYTELTTSSQNPAGLLGHANLSSEVVKTHCALEQPIVKRMGTELIAARVSFDLFGLNLSAVLLPATAVGVMEAMLKCGLHSWRVWDHQVSSRWGGHISSWMAGTWEQEGFAGSEEAHNESNTISASLRVGNKETL